MHIIINLLMRPNTSFRSKSLTQLRFSPTKKHNLFLQTRLDEAKSYSK